MRVHYELTYAEEKALRGGRYLDASRKREMICRTGDGHAKGCREWAAVTCEDCLKHRPKPNWTIHGEDREVGAIGVMVPFAIFVSAYTEDEARDLARERRYALGREHVHIKRVLGDEY